MWKNVNDGLPEADVLVLVYYGVGGMDIMDIDYNGNLGDSNGIYKVTHWMYLPKPPNSEQGEAELSTSPNNQMDAIALVNRAYELSHELGHLQLAKVLLKLKNVIVAQRHH